MNKLLIIAPWVVLGVVMAGLYGIANNQVTYTLSPEFYREYKFLSFGVQDIRGQIVCGSQRLGGWRRGGLV